MRISSTPLTSPIPKLLFAIAKPISVTSAILADSQGRTLYALTKDTNGIPTCTGACARAWPPATITGAASPASGVSAPTTVVDAPDGGKMLKVGKWPLYRFAGDAAPGDINGQGSGGVFFVVGADGKLIKA